MFVLAWRASKCLFWDTSELGRVQSGDFTPALSRRTSRDDRVEQREIYLSSEIDPPQYFRLKLMRFQCQMNQVKATQDKASSVSKSLAHAHRPGLDQLWMA